MPIDFRLLGLPIEIAHNLFSLSDEELERLHCRRVVADASPGYPCRISLQDAAVGSV
jgi:hypothetical protein